MTDSAIKILIVDDHPLVRMGLSALLTTVGDFAVVGEAASVAQALELATRGHPDVVIMDVRLPDGSGVEACREIRSQLPSTNVLILTSYDDQEAVLASIMARASGYLLKQVEPERLIDAIRLIARGGSLLDPAVTATVLERLRQAGRGAAADPLLGLSEQERRILPLIAEGKTNREIGAALFLSEYTVKTYVSEILQKLHLSRRSQAAAFITRHALTTP